MMARFRPALTVLGLLVATTVSAHGDDEELPPPEGWRNPAPLELERMRPTLQRDALLDAVRETRDALRREVPHLVGPDAGRCDTCTRLTQDLLAIADDATAEQDLDALAAVLCEALFGNATDADKVCVSLPKLLFTGAQYIKQVGANASNILCDDLLLLCRQPCCLTSTTPEQLHLSFTANQTLLPSGLSSPYRVTWVTLEPVAGGQVQWYAADGSTGRSTAAAGGPPRHYDIGNWEGYIYSAVMEPLQPGTTYTYRVGSAGGGWSAWFNTTTVPANAGTPERPLSFIGVADMGYKAFANVTVNAIAGMVERGIVDFVLHPGDIGYADADQHYWDEFFRAMQPIFTRVPYMTVPGNHECMWWNCTAYKNRFWMPPAGHGAPSDASYWSLTVPAASTTFAMLNSENGINTPHVDAAQKRWFVATSAASEAGLLYVMHHRPLYCSSNSSANCESFCKYMRDALEVSYRDEKVAAVMVGHLHNYERTFPVFNGTVVGTTYDDASAPGYLINGGAGSPEGMLGFMKAQPSWSAFRSEERSFMHHTVVATPGGNVTMEARTIRSTMGTVMDSIVVTRPFSRR